MKFTLALTAAGLTLAALALLRLPERAGPAAGAPALGGGGYDVEGRWQGSAPQPGARPNVVLVVLDGLRGSAMQRSGEGAGWLPSLERLITRGVRLDSAFSAAPQSAESLASLLTGRLPSSHGLGSGEGRTGRLGALPTLAEILSHTAGYATEAWVPAARLGGPGTALEGFERVERGVALADIPERVRTRAAGTGAPLFLLVASDEFAGAYAEAGPDTRPGADAQAAPESSEERAVRLVRAYALSRAERARLDAAEDPSGDARLLRRALATPELGARHPELATELARAYAQHLERLDEPLQRALQALERLPGAENTLLIVTAGHGTFLGERGWLLAAPTPRREMLHVPLLFVGPAPFDAPRADAGPVSLLDVMPTVLTWLGLPQAQELDGRSLLPLPEGSRPGHPVAAQARHVLSDGVHGVDALIEAVHDAGWSYLLTYDRLAGTVLEEAYDLANDAQAEHNLADASGRVGALGVSPDFCARVEEARDRVWGAVAGVAFMLESGYMSGPAYVRSERPARLCAPSAAR